MKKNIKIFISEINGVWTDGGFYINASGTEHIKFNFYDQSGLELLNKTGFTYFLISSEKSEAQLKALRKFRITNYKTGSKKKLAYLDSYLKKNKLSWDEVAYLGSSAEDVEILQKAGLSAVPASAPFYIKDLSDWILRRKGGEGAFAEFIERYLEENDLLKKTLGLPEFLVIR